MDLVCCSYFPHPLWTCIITIIIVHFCYLPWHTLISGTYIHIAVVNWCRLSVTPLPELWYSKIGHEPRSTWNQEWVHSSGPIAIYQRDTHMMVVQWLRSALSDKHHIFGICIPSPVHGNRSSFWNYVFLRTPDSAEGPKSRELYTTERTI
jgi:hypothetical protein